MKVIIGFALLALAYGQTFEQVPIKTQPMMEMVNSHLTTETGMKNINWNNWNGDWNLMTIQEIIQHPLFQVYYQLPLFRQHFSHPLFQLYLTTPQFQTYWTHPVFPTFFQNPVLFYKYIYPQIFTNNFQTPVVQPTPVALWNKMFPTTTTFNNYDEVIRKMLGVEDVQKMNFQNMYMDKMMKNVFPQFNKEMMPEIQTDIKMIPQMMVNPINKMLNEKMMMTEETPLEMIKDTLMKDDITKGDMTKEELIKKFYLEKMMNKNVYPWMNRFSNNKIMTPEDLLLLQNKMEELIPTRVRRNANYVQLPTTAYANKNVKALPFFYNVPVNQQVYYTQPTTYANTIGYPYQYTNTAGYPYQYTNTAGYPYQYTNTLGAQYTYANSVPLQYTNTFGTPYVYPTQTVV